MSSNKQPIYHPQLTISGLSYGTVVGATAAAMFPDKVESIVLDGVQNLHEYYYGK